MKNTPVYENLETSFVDLPALIEYLRGQRFAGRIRLSRGDGYEAEITFTAEGKTGASERENTGAPATDDADALRRILLRARTPGGNIDVYRTIGRAETAAENTEKGDVRQIENESAAPRPGRADLMNLPFELSNNYEDRARAQTTSAADRAGLLELTGELLETIDGALAPAKLDFKGALEKACAEVSADYPFLKSLRYTNGKARLHEPFNAKIFAAGIAEALRLIFEKLGSIPRYAEAHRDAAQKVLALIYHRRELFDKFSLTAPLHKMLGA